MKNRLAHLSGMNSMDKANSMASAEKRKKLNAGDCLPQNVHKLQFTQHPGGDAHSFN